MERRGPPANSASLRTALLCKLTRTKLPRLGERLPQKHILKQKMSGRVARSLQGVAVALKQAMTPEFRVYQQQVVANCRALAEALTELGYKIVTGGSDNHLILVDLRSKGTDGGRAEKVLEACSIACNKNTCPGDRSALRPSGLRLGTPALTSRGLLETEFRKVAHFIHKGIELTLQIQKDAGDKASLKEFKEKLAGDERHRGAIRALREEVESFASLFPLPGLPDF
uniref:glycine hydroxymethyltransferase n=1 Tax=Myotis myotis TaxID=51298 RepID=A0A7J7RDP3_MYOMY|nr:serine hydroxymethyltransferase 1 [Myotis myotis]